MTHTVGQWKNTIGRVNDVPHDTILSTETIFPIIFKYYNETSTAWCAFHTLTYNIPMTKLFRANNITIIALWSWRCHACTRVSKYVSPVLFVSISYGNIERVGKQQTARSRTRKSNNNYWLKFSRSEDLLLLNILQTFSLKNAVKSLCVMLQKNNVSKTFIGTTYNYRW